MRAPVTNGSMTDHTQRVLTLFVRAGRATVKDAREEFTTVSGDITKHAVASLVRAGFLVGVEDCQLSRGRVYEITAAGKQRFAQLSQPTVQTVERLSVWERGTLAYTPAPAARPGSMDAYSLTSRVGLRDVPYTTPLLMSSRVTAGVPGR